MKILNPEYLILDYDKLKRAEETKDQIVRTVLDSGENFNRFTGYKELKQTTMAYKSAKQEATNDDEFELYFGNLQKGLEYVLSHISDNEPELNLDHKHFLGLNSIISPETYCRHPNGYRNTEVIIGNDAPPEPKKLYGIMNEFIYHLNTIENPILKAAYCHFETVRIHPFGDGNGRTARLMANWILMQGLFTPTYTNLNQVSDYRAGIGKATGELEKTGGFPMIHTNHLFDSTIDKIQTSLDSTLNYLNQKSEPIPHIDLEVKGIDKEIIYALRNGVKQCLNRGVSKPIGVAILDDDLSHKQGVLRFSGIDNKELSRVKKAVKSFIRGKPYAKKTKLEYL